MNLASFDDLDEAKYYLRHVYVDMKSRRNEIKHVYDSMLYDGFERCVIVRIKNKENYGEGYTLYKIYCEKDSDSSWFKYKIFFRVETRDKSGKNTTKIAGPIKLYTSTSAISDKDCSKLYIRHTNDDYISIIDYIYDDIKMEYLFGKKFEPNLEENKNMTMLSDSAVHVGWLPKIRKVIFNNPATIIIWADNTKTVVTCQKGETYDPEKGLALAISKKTLGNKYDYYNTFKKYLKNAPESGPVKTRKKKKKTTSK